MTILSSHVTVARGGSLDIYPYEENRYMYAVRNAKDIGLGFDKYEVLNSTPAQMVANTTPQQIHQLLNAVNSAIRKVATTYLYGFKSVRSLSKEDKLKLGKTASNKELLLRFAIYHDKTNPTLAYVRENVGRFVLYKN